MQYDQSGCKMLMSQTKLHKHQLNLTVNYLLITVQDIEIVELTIEI